jgi:hypothetical protein
MWIRALDGTPVNTDQCFKIEVLPLWHGLTDAQARSVGLKNAPDGKIIVGYQVLAVSTVSGGYSDNFGPETEVLCFFVGVGKKSDDACLAAKSKAEAVRDAIFEGLEEGDRVGSVERVIETLGLEGALPEHPF